MTAQQKSSNTKAPNPILHMLLWGFGSGTILAALFIAFFLSLIAIDYFAPLMALINPTTWLLALQYGGLSGAALGLVTGLVLWAMQRNFPEPFTREAMQTERLKVYGVVGNLSLILGLLLTVILFWPPNFMYSFFGLLIPFPPLFIFASMIAALAAAYAGHRYLFRLRLWSEAEYGILDEKAKNTERLEDKLKNEDIENDDEDGDIAKNEAS